MVFVPLERLVNLHDGYRRTFRIGRLPLLLIQEGGQRYVLQDRCPHKGFPLHTGTLVNGRLRCAYHAMEFDLASGRCLQHPSQPGVVTYPVVVDGVMVGVELDTRNAEE